MTHSDCQTWKDPTSVRLVQVGPLLRDHPNVRALMVCESCNQPWLYDFLDSEDWGGEGAGRVVYAPVPEAVETRACAQLSARDVETLRPRLVVHDFVTGKMDRVA